MLLVVCVWPKDPIQRSHQTEVVNLGLLLGKLETLPVVWTWLSLSLPTIHCALTEYVFNSVIIGRSYVAGE
jgi:hypothetical protein